MTIELSKCCNAPKGVYSGLEGTNHYECIDCGEQFIPAEHGFKAVTITAPLAVYLPRKTKAAKKYIINKNVERNMHFIVSNQVKQAYASAIHDQIKGIVFNPPVRLDLTYWKPTNRRSDRSNVLCIHEKFAMDAIVKAGGLPDDCDEYIESTHYYGGELDRQNPRVEITITETTRKDNQ